MDTQNEAQNSSKPVSIKRTVTVHPKSKHPMEALQLSNLDRQCPELMYLVFFYKSCRQGYPHSAVFERLKSGLEETMSVWYPSAGRLRRDEQKRLNIWCNDEGAIMVEASTPLKMEEIGELSTYTAFFENLVYKPSFPMGDYSHMPLVVAQVTRFGCGGYSIGIGISHSLFDGSAAFNFLQAWSVNSTVSKETRRGGGLEVQVHTPLLCRGSLLHLVSNAQGPPPSRNKIPTAIDHLYELIMKSAEGNTNCASTPTFLHKTFHLNGETIASWKRRFFTERRGSSSSSFLCSDFEVVAAHLWKSRTKSLGLNRGASACLQFPVDARTKMSPPLPKGFSGNCYVLVSIMMKAEELEKSSYESVVCKIREAKKSVTTDYVISYISALEYSQVNTSLPPIRELTFVSDWTRMPFHKVGFLKEHADYVSPLVPPIPQVACFMQNPKDSKGIDVRIGLFTDIVDAFSNNFMP